MHPAVKVLKRAVRKAEPVMVVDNGWNVARWTANNFSKIFSLESAASGCEPPCVFSPTLLQRRHHEYAGGLLSYVLFTALSAMNK